MVIRTIADRDLISMSSHFEICGSVTGFLEMKSFVSTVLMPARLLQRLCWTVFVSSDTTSPVWPWSRQKCKNCILKKKI